MISPNSPAGRLSRFLDYYDGFMFHTSAFRCSEIDNEGNEQPPYGSSLTSWLQPWGCV